MEQLWSVEALRAHWVLSSGELELLKEMLGRRGLTPWVLPEVFPELCAAPSAFQGVPMLSVYSGF